MEWKENADGIFLPIKAQSVNRLWQGRRFKTPEYKRYREELDLLIRASGYRLNKDWDELMVYYEFGLSNMRQDLDNCLKGVNDALQETLGFDDHRIKMIMARKVKVRKGEEFIRVRIENCNNQPNTHNHGNEIETF